jgi:hypothetical protein
MYRMGAPSKPSLGDDFLEQHSNVQESTAEQVSQEPKPTTND